MRETIGLSDTGSRPQSIGLSDMGLTKNYQLPTSANHTAERKLGPLYIVQHSLWWVLSELQSASAPVHRGRLLVVG